jgi:hypothetical protein
MTEDTPIPSYESLMQDMEVVPHSVSYHKWLALKRFIETPIYGMGKTWPHWRKRGWRLVRLKIEERAKS